MECRTPRAAARLMKYWPPPPSSNPSNKSRRVQRRGHRKAHQAATPSLSAPCPHFNVAQSKVSDSFACIKLAHGQPAKRATCPASQFKACIRLQVQYLDIAFPVHQKSSALGIRVKDILPPTFPPGGGCQKPTLATVLPYLIFSRSSADPSLSHFCRSLSSSNRKSS